MQVKVVIPRYMVYKKFEWSFEWLPNSRISGIFDGKYIGVTVKLSFLFLILFVDGISFGPAIARSPNHDPHQKADDIESTGPPRRMNPDEDNQSDKIIKKDEASHSALIFDNGRKNTVPLSMRNGI